MRVRIRRFERLRLAGNHFSAPERTSPLVIVGASPLRRACEASPRSLSGSSACAEFRRLALFGLTAVSLSLRFGPSPTGFQGPALSGCLLWPRLTSRSAVTRRPFRRKARAPQVRLRDLPRTTAGSTPWLLGREGFAVLCPLALIHSALYPIPVRRLAGLLHASFSARLAAHALRLASARCDLLAQKTFTS